MTSLPFNLPSSKDVNPNFILDKQEKIDKENPNRIALFQDNFSCLLLGPSRSGKTKCLLNLLMKPEYYKDYFDDIHWFVTTFYTDPSYRIIDSDPKFIHTKVDSAIIAKAIDDQTQRKTFNLPAKKICMVFDDVAGQSHLDTRKLGIMDTLFVQGRKSDISVFVAMQLFKEGISKTTRNNATDVVMWNFGGEMNMEIMKAFCSELSTPEQRTLLKLAFTDRNDFLWIRCKETKNKYCKNFNTFLYPDKNTEKYLKEYSNQKTDYFERKNVIEAAFPHIKLPENFVDFKKAIETKKKPYTIKRKRNAPELGTNDDISDRESDSNEDGSEEERDENKKQKLVDYESD